MSHLLFSQKNSSHLVCSIETSIAVTLSRDLIEKISSYTPQETIQEPNITIIVRIVPRTLKELKSQARPLLPIHREESLWCTSLPSMKMSIGGRRPWNPSRQGGRPPFRNHSNVRKRRETTCQTVLSRASHPRRP